MYTSTTPPRYFGDDHRLKEFDRTLSLDVHVTMAPSRQRT
ncbi:hypothetical protein GGE07_005106 [Sinorhizobium terangae]|nr:hypothetical protein [Sinorhizobium terangae]